MNPIEGSSPVQVAVAHRDPIVALGLRAALADQGDMRLLPGPEVPNGAEQADVVVCDLETGQQMARERGRRLAPVRAAQRILIFTRRISEQETRQTLLLGAHGCLLSESSVEDLLQGVRSVARGQNFLSPALAQLVAASLTYTPLTPRENDVLNWLSSGHCNKSIARRLGISVPTVKAHVKAIMSKMNAASRTQAVSIAAKRGLVGLSQHSVT